MKQISLVLILAALLVSVLAFDVSYHGSETITTFDDVALHADGFSPVPQYSGQKFPLLIFANSWSMPQVEYIVKALQFAEQGYVTLEYETRGWWLSGGIVDCAGPLDRRDISSVIDFAFSKADAWNINTSSIAFIGISYGGGLATQAAGFEPRLTTIVSLSGWANLTQALYEHTTVNTAWGGALLLLSDIVGHPNPELAELWTQLIAHQNIPGVEAFAEKRSAGVNISYMNARNIPMLISNNFLDRLFKPNDQLAFYLNLTTPKMLLLNQGMHAAAELGGLIGLSNQVWHQTRKWLDYWLKGIDNGIMSEPQIQVEVEFKTNDYVNFTEWPSKHISNVPYFFGNRANNKYGRFAAGSPPAPIDGPLDIVNYDTIPGINDGVPIISDALNEIIPENNELLLYNTAGAIVFMSAPLVMTTRVCGIPEISLSFIPSSDTWQMYAMLYDVDALDIGVIMSDMYFTNYGKGVFNNNTVQLKTSFHMICRDVSAGKRLGVGITLYNAAYTQATTDFNVMFQYDENTYVTIPTYIQ